MKNVLFLMTHLDCDWELIRDKLATDPRIEMFCTGREYSHPDDLKDLIDLPHKMHDANSVWGDVLFFNEQLTCKQLCQSCKFLYYDGPIVKDSQMSYPVNYKQWRLSGMKQYYAKTGGVWLDESGLDSFFVSSL